VEQLATMIRRATIGAESESVDLVFEMISRNPALKSLRVWGKSSIPSAFSSNIKLSQVNTPLWETPVADVDLSLRFGCGVSRDGLCTLKRLFDNICFMVQLVDLQYIVEYGDNKIEVKNTSPYHYSLVTP
jgi:hypothetical protein